MPQLLEATAVLGGKLPVLLATTIPLLHRVRRMADLIKAQDDIDDEREAEAAAKMDASDGYVAPPRYGPNPFSTVDENVLQSQ